MLILTKFINSFFQEATFSNYFEIFKQVPRESLSHRVPSVHKQACIGIQMKTLQIQGVEIILLQCYFNVPTLKQRLTNAIYTPCVCRLIIWKCTRKTLSMGCNLNKIYLKICFHCTSSNKTSKITKICHSPKTSLGRCLSVLVKFYSICGYKILTGFFFKGVNKSKKLLKKKG